MSFVLPRRLSVLRSGVVVAAACAVAGCSAYDSRYVFMPKPAQMHFAASGGPHRSAGALVAVAGVRNADASVGTPAALEVLLLISNDSGQTIYVDPANLRLFAGNLAEFPAPMMQPAGVFAVAAGETAAATAWFPFPDGRVPGGYDLDGLNLRWGIEVGSETVTQGVSFVRAQSRPQPPYPAWFGFGHRGYGGHRGYDGHRHARPSRPPRDSVRPTRPPTVTPPVTPPGPQPVRPTHPPYLRSGADGRMQDL